MSLSPLKQVVLASGRRGAKLGIILYVMRGGEPRYVLVTSTGRGKRRWSPPKGTIEEGETRREVAVEEAWEEAGVKIKRRQLSAVGHYLGGRDPIVVFMAEAEEKQIKPSWPEGHERRRVIVPYDEAVRLLRGAGAKKNKWVIKALKRVQKFAEKEAAFSEAPLAPKKKKKRK